jgi:hypothetical protein
LGTYSFIDVTASITGPGGAFQLGYGAGTSEEGITIEMAEDKDTMTTGADGSVMHSLHAGNAGSVTVRLLKTSPTNAMLQAMYDFQTLSSALHGQNVIVVSNVATGDVTTCVGVAFRRKPNLTYAKEGGTNEWAFNAGRIFTMLGATPPQVSV